MGWFDALSDIFSDLKDPDADRMNAMKEAVCSIETKKSKGIYGGHGVFILPDVVVTAWHVIKGAKDTVFINGRGEEAGILSGGIKKFNTELDLAIVELDRTLCKKPAIYGDTDAYLNDMKGTLVTRFTGPATAHATGVHTSRMVFDYVVNSKGAMRNFQSEIKCGPGYSGSPVFDSRGRVCTILSQGQWENQNDYDADKSWSKNFAGPAPYRFAGFIKQSLDI